MPELDKDYGHKPVLLRECLEALAIRPDGTYVDGTLGRAGHSLEILRRLTEGGRLIGIDRDMAAIEAARERLAAFSDRVTLVHGNFSDLGNILRDLGVRTMRLLTNNPDKIYQLADFGLEIVERVPIQIQATQEDLFYLQTKQHRMGHILDY